MEKSGAGLLGRHRQNGRSEPTFLYSPLSPPTTLPHLSPHQPYPTQPPSNLSSFLQKTSFILQSSPQGQLPLSNSWNPHALCCSPRNLAQAA